MIYELRYPVSCTTPLGDAYIWYIKPNGYLENDEVTCILMDSGIIRHFTTDQIKIWHNATYKIKKQKNDTPPRTDGSLH
jgi:hypothetical protein